jgi:PemK-like, MazF-like toxin of type II toxin-antitoxin system
VTIVPVTLNTDRVYPFQVLLPADATGLAADSKAQAEQVRSIAVERIGSRVGLMTAELQVGHRPLARLDQLARLDAEHVVPGAGSGSRLVVLQQVRLDEHP